MEETVARREEEKKSANWFEEHPKTTFWSRFVSWVTFAGVLPFVFIAWRFKIFNKVSQMQISGWGIIGIIIVMAVAYTIIKYVKLAFSKKYSLTGQILTGIAKIIVPLIGFLLILKNIRDNIDLLMQVVGCVAVCETIAIPLNPLPQWAYEMQKDVAVEERKETMDYLLDGFFRRKKEE